MLFANRFTRLKRALPAGIKSPLKRAYGATLTAVSRGVHRHYDLSRTILVVSTPRSGSTWLMNLVTSLPGACPVFEALNANEQSELVGMDIDFTPRIRPAEPRPDLEAYLRRVFTGHLVSRWTSDYASLRQLIRAGDSWSSLSGRTA